MLHLLQSRDIPDSLEEFFLGILYPFFFLYVCLSWLICMDSYRAWLGELWMENWIEMGRKVY